MPNEIQEQNQKKSRKVKKIALKIILICLGIFLFGYGFIAMLFNFKIGLLISVIGIGILFFSLYHSYNP
ncbi:MAG: hypothetical protein U9M94_00110 [Patescibacteria group bacterium]|nr:hypothetical protein [Patescibacteria group bacterium]